MKTKHLFPVITLILILIGPAAVNAQTVFSAAGPDAASITPTVNNYRSALGILNPNVAGSLGSGRREINWDGVPDAFAAPNNLPANFFNVNSPRGTVFSTPGTGFQVSANAGSGPIQFDNINPTYSTIFEPFSPQRLFTALDSNIVDVNFFIPGSNTPAVTNGFGAIFSDVDLAGSSISLFDALGASLGTFAVPAIAGNETFSFLGILYADPIISRVRITSGNSALGAAILETSIRDLVVMDDFIYGEPVAPAVPDTGSSIVLLTFALIGVGALRHRTKERRHAY